MSRKVLIFSPAVLWSEKDKSFYKGIPEVLKKLTEQGAYAVISSNHSEPEWFKEIKEERCMWIQVTGRQSGKWIPSLLKANAAMDLLHSEIVILGASEVDMQMAANSTSLLVRCDWAEGVAEIEKYGVGWESPETLPDLVKYLDDQVPWYFESSNVNYRAFALTDAGTYGVDAETEAAANAIRAVLKNGRSDYRNRLVLHMMASINKTDIFSKADLFGYYPSSKSTNAGEEVMAGFCRYARELFKKRLKEPLFLRHKPADSRHTQRGGDRENPLAQIESVHLNPFYRGKISGKTVVVFDDYLTYGVSFGWAKSLLMAAGAKSVICIALGRFGNQAREYTINIDGNDPFAPAKSKQYNCRIMPGTLDQKAKLVLKEKFGRSK